MWFKLRKRRLTSAMLLKLRKRRLRRDFVGGSAQCRRGRAASLAHAQVPSMSASAAFSAAVTLSFQYALTVIQDWA